MKDERARSLKRIEMHANALMKIPSGEQFIGAIQAVMSVALLDIKRALGEVASKAKKGVGRERCR